MEITVSKLENVKELKTVSAISVFGTGFLTSIVSAFIELLGTENKKLINKMEKAKESAMLSLIQQAKSSSEADGIMNLSFQVSGKAVLAYGTVFQHCDGTSDSSSNNSHNTDTEPKSEAQTKVDSERIRTLKKLYSQGLITEEEYQEAISRNQ